MNRRFAVILSLVGGLTVVVAGVVILKDQGGHRNAGFAAGTHTFEVEEGPAPAGVSRGSRPVNGGSEAEIPGRFRVKFDRHGAGGVAFSGGRLTAADPAIAATLGRFKSARAAFRFAPEAPLGASLGLTKTYEIESDDDLATLRAELEGKGTVEWVEPVYRMTALGQPDDPYYSLQWDLSSVDYPSISSIEDGTGVIVAVIDSGVSKGPDGYAHLGNGYDFVDSDTDASDADGESAGFSHGTHVAGTIAEATGNGVGAASLAPGVTLMPIRVLGLDSSTGLVSGPDSDIASGIIWAVDHGADVINLSLGGPGYSASMADACDYAHEQGVVVVAATGNDGYTDGVIYPAALPTVIAVGAVDRNHVVTYYSNGGPEIDVVAPGGDADQDIDHDGNGDGILQESFGTNGWQYFLSTGTSMASPHVAAAAALLVARGYTDPDDVFDALTSTCTDLGSANRDDLYGHGEVNVMAALQLAVPEDDEPDDGGGGGGGGETEPGADGGDDDNNGGGGGGNGSGNQESSQPLALTDMLASQASEGHLSITWRTNLGATTELRDDRGGAYVDDSLVTAHTVVATGNIGDKAVFTIRSSSEDGQTAVGTVTAEFKESSQGFPPGVANCATGGGDAAWTLALLGLLVSTRRRASSLG